MPKVYRKKIFRKRNPRKYRYKRRGGKKTAQLPLIMRPLRYRFKRDLEQVVQLNSSPAPDGWNADGNYRLYGNLAWSLGSLGATSMSDFTNLFRQYKIHGARVRFYFSNTVSGSSTVGTALGEVAYNTNSQMLVRMSTNQRGLTETLDTAYWTQRQAKKYRTAINGGKPIDVYMPLFIKNEIASSTGTTTSMKKPQFVSTDQTNVVHHGLNISVERVDGQPFSDNHNNYQYMKVITTLYLEFRGTE